MYVDLVKKVNSVDSDKENLEKKIEDVDKKIPDTSKFIVTWECNVLTKTDSNAWMSEALKKLATENK